MRCTASGDPHFKLFSGHKVDAMGLGVYPYVDVAGLKIQHFHCPLPQRACWRGASMTTGTAIQIGTDVITIAKDVVKINGVTEPLPLSKTIGTGATAITVTGESSRSKAQYRISSQIGDDPRRPRFTSMGSVSLEVDVKLSGREAGCSTMGYLHDVKYHLCRDRPTEGFAPNICALDRAVSALWAQTSCEPSAPRRWR